MYNEDDQLFLKTMNAVVKNIAHLCSRTKSKMWGPEGWKKVVVCVVSDGRLKVHPRVLKVLGAMGVYQVWAYIDIFQKKKKKVLYSDRARQFCYV